MTSEGSSFQFQRDRCQERGEIIVRAPPGEVGGLSKNQSNASPPEMYEDG